MIPSMPIFHEVMRQDMLVMPPANFNNIDSVETHVACGCRVPSRIAEFQVYQCTAGPRREKMF